MRCMARILSAKEAELVAALSVEIARQPLFDRWPALMDRATAMQIALEKCQEWDYEADAHGWCHERPVLLTLLASLV